MCGGCRQRLDKDMRMHDAREVEFGSKTIYEHIQNGTLTYATMHRGHVLGSLGSKRKLYKYIIMS
jgi:hypothetical protein